MEFTYTSLFLCCATIFFLLGWLDMLPLDRINSRMRWLKQHGTPIVARIDEISRFTKHGSKIPSWTIKASWNNPRDGKRYYFKSAPLEFDPGIFLKSGIITVLIDSHNPRSHYIDVSELRVMAGR